MARPSKLTEKQWREIESRHLAGEKIRPLAREFKVSEAAIRARVSAQTKQVKSVANQMIAAECALKALPVSAQINALNLADQLRAISSHLCGAASFGAMTAHRLSGIANQRADRIDGSEATTDADMDNLKMIAGLAKVANESAEIGLNLLKANKEAFDSAKDDDPLLPTTINVERRSARIAE